MTVLTVPFQRFMALLAKNYCLDEMSAFEEVDSAMVQKQARWHHHKQSFSYQRVRSGNRSSCSVSGR